MKRLLLIDAYAMIYRAYYAFIQHPRVTSDGRNTSAIYGFVLTLDDLIRKLNPTHLGVAFDPKGKTFRHEAYEQYKAQRPDTPEDIHAAVPVIKQILAARNIPVLEVEGFEADDVIGTLAHKAEKADFTVFMATPDKDYGQLVTERIFMYRPRHSGGYEQMGPKEVCDKYGINSTEQVIDLLSLMGDTSDNIPGCKGVGEKTAVRLLQDYGSIDNLLEHTDELKGALQTKIVTQQEAIRFSRFLATIRQDVPIELDEQELAVHKPDNNALSKIYTELEFRSLLRQQPSVTQQPIEQPIEQPAEQPAAPPAPQIVEQTLFPPLEQTLKSIEPIYIDKMPQGVERLSFATEQHQTAIQQDLFSSIEQTALTVYVSFGTVGDGNPQIYKTALNEPLRSLLADPAVLKIGYDLKNEYKRLKENGVTLAGPLYDVTVMHYLLQPEQDHQIEALSEAYLSLSCTQSIAQKVVAAELMHSYFTTHLSAEDNHRLQLLRDTEMRLIPVLAEMELAGVRFSLPVLKEASIKLGSELQHLEEEIEEMAGSEINISSPKQVGELLFNKLKLTDKARKTRTGHYITSEEVLQELQYKHPIVGLILEYRAVKKLLSTYIDALPELINPLTGKVHTTYNQTITATGRLSSSNPNLQNLPIRSERGKEIRRAVIADKNCIFLSADYSQIELRLMAHLSGDEHLTEAFRSGQDIHAATAAKIFGCELNEVTKDMRRRAKTANFGIIYGISAFGLAQQLGSSRQEAKELIDGYFRSFPRIVQFIEEQKEYARRNGYVQTMFGRRRYLPDINSRNPTVRSFAERNAVNAPIQGTAADIIKIAMVRIYEQLRLNNLHATMIMQVHDELNFNVPEQEEERVRQIVVSEMQHAVSLNVPLIADCGVGLNWLEAH